MSKGIYAGVSGMMTQQTIVDCAANNLANVDTAGFRGRKAISKSFPEVLMERVDPKGPRGNIPPWPWGDKALGSASINEVISETYMMTGAGNLQVTDAPLDLAIEDPASFFVLQDGEGKRSYTRAGHFILNSEGQVSTPDGYLLVGDGGPMDAGDSSSVHFSDDGQLYVDGVVSGQIQLVQFENPGYLQNMGKNLLTENDDSGAPLAVDEPAIMTGSLERSNVNVVEEMARLIEAQRAYEAASKGIKTSDSMTGQLISSLAKP